MDDLLDKQYPSYKEDKEEQYPSYKEEDKIIKVDKDLYIIKFHG